MKRILLLGLACMLMASLAFAQGQQGQPEDVGQPEDAGNDVEIEPIMAQGGEMLGEAVQEQNMGEDQQIQERVRAKEGDMMMEGGKMLKLEKGEGERMQLKAGEMMAETGMEMVQEQNKLKVKLSNGKYSEIKIMPDTASERALERLRLKVCSPENNCQIELKEVGSGEQAKAAYELKVEKKARLFGIFGTQMQVEAQIDAENGEVIKAKKPWWAFMASEPEE